ncbi:hypothetical protein IMSAGC017_00429 [Thomasclavelia cocleata]|uniref:LPXTG-motif cell wall anchor domain-containing protein n=1 Tax=Thomasclavelia cocleata TaxID=69824 RepID=A0A829Z8H6_9FIRM|nr:hypothetical protein IMSAGC017_00429 [Thomasclavelia cocleata]
MAESASLENVVPAVVEEFNTALENAQTVYANDNATQEEVEATIASLTKALARLEANLSNLVVNGTNTSVKLGVSLNTGDTTYMFNVLGLMALLSVVACLKKKKFN